MIADAEESQRMTSGQASIKVTGHSSEGKVLGG